ncbi:8157_t:CDS:1, partial [Scutellospora calospora]
DTTIDAKVADAVDTSDHKKNAEDGKQLKNNARGKKEVIGYLYSNKVV